jgi:hypothetical protein
MCSIDELLGTSTALPLIQLADKKQDIFGFTCSALFAAEFTMHALDSSPSNALCTSN